MKIYLFFLIIPFLLIPTASAEVGKDFDSVTQLDGSIIWTSHYDRILENGRYVNQIVNDKAGVFEYRSGNIFFDFDKVDCSFTLYDPVTNALIIPEFSTQLKIANATLPQGFCNFENLIETNESVSFTIEKNGYDTDYVLNAFGKVEWTYSSPAQNGAPRIFSIIETCLDCPFGSSDGTKVKFGTYTFDSKNEIHNSLFDIDLSNGFRAEYRQTLGNGEKLNIDPVFNYDDVVFDIQVTTGNQISTACRLSGFFLTDGTDPTMQLQPNTLDRWCTRITMEWDITSIPDDATITDTSFRYEIASTLGNPEFCNFHEMDHQPSTLNAEDTWFDAGNGTLFVAGVTGCTTVGVDKIQDLGTDADTDLESQLALDWFGMGIKTQSEVRDNQTPTSRFAELMSELQVTYTIPLSGVDTLVITDTRGTGVDLDWQAPATTGTIIDYQINFTTPHSENVATVLINETGSTTTFAVISALAGETQYSFRIGVRTADQLNATGNVANTTTLFDPTEAFTAGSFNITAIGIDVRDFKFERIDLNTTALLLNVTYPNSFNATCNFYFKFAMVNQTHINIPDVAINAAEDEASFRFEGVDNDIIEVTCNDENSNSTGNFLITQTSFMILEQIQDFQSGKFGTMGKFGALDFITVIAVMASMIGFNRINESVGVILGVIMIGGFSVFQIIQWETTFTASLALVILWAYTNTRKT